MTVLELVCKNCGKGFASNRSQRNYCSHKCANIHSGADRAAKPAGETATTVWSCGGGVQSTAIAVMIENGKLPMPDYGVMVDCGYEKAETLEYMRSVTIPRMRQAGMRFEMIDTLTYSNNDLTNGKGLVHIPAFKLYPDGSIGKLNTMCNNTWKSVVSKRWMREQGITFCDNWIGISADEKKRARKSPLKWLAYSYPLIDHRMSREACIYEIAKAGWPMPPRTSCIFCPLQSDDQWEHTYRNHPDDWAKALKAERVIREAAPDIYLHRSCRPLGSLFTSPPIPEG